MIKKSKNSSGQQSSSNSSMRITKAKRWKPYIDPDLSSSESSLSSSDDEEAATAKQVNEDNDEVSSSSEEASESEESDEEEPEEQDSEDSSDDSESLSEASTSSEKDSEESVSSDDASASRFKTLKNMGGRKSMVPRKAKLKPTPVGVSDSSDSSASEDDDAPAQERSRKPTAPKIKQSKIPNVSNSSDDSGSSSSSSDSDDDADDDDDEPPRRQPTNIIRSSTTKASRTAAALPAKPNSKLASSSTKREPRKASASCESESDYSSELSGDEVKRRALKKSSPLMKSTAKAQLSKARTVKSKPTAKPKLAKEMESKMMPVKRVDSSSSEDDSSDSDMRRTAMSAVTKKKIPTAATAPIKDGTVAKASRPSDSPPRHPARSHVQAPSSPRKPLLSPSLKKLKVVIKPLAHKGPHSPRKRPLTPGKLRRGVLRHGTKGPRGGGASRTGPGKSPSQQRVRRRVSFSEEGNDLNLFPRVEDRDKSACYYTKTDLRRFELERKAERQAEQLQKLEQMMAQASLLMSAGVPLL